jgi:hypothetical protein
MRKKINRAKLMKDIEYLRTAKKSKQTEKLKRKVLKDIEKLRKMR